MELAGVQDLNYAQTNRKSGLECRSIHWY